MLQPRKDLVILRLQQALLLVISLLTASVTLAQPYTNCGNCKSLVRPIVALGGGVAITSKLGKSTTFVDPGTGGLDIYSTSNAIQTVGAFDGFFGLEWAFHPRSELEIGFGYNQTTSLASNGTVLQSIGTPFANSSTYLFRVIARQYLAESKLLFNFYECYHPYVELGLGVSQNAAYAYQTNSISASPPIYPNQTNTSFSYNAGIGIDFDALSYLRLGLGYRFANFGKVRLGNTIINTTPVVGVLSQSSFYVNEALAQITFLFF